jgi:hypothetical protein
MGRYAVQFAGACQGDWLANGATLLVDPELEIRRFDLVAIILNQDGGRWAELLNAAGGNCFGVVKLYLGNYEAAAGRAHIVAQLAPPCVAIIPDTAIEAMHRIVGADCNRMSDEDKQALELVRPFANGNCSLPIDPDWRQELERAA